MNKEQLKALLKEMCESGEIAVQVSVNRSGGHPGYRDISVNMLIDNTVVCRSEDSFSIGAAHEYRD